ncbi:tyrosine-type recombinase/integrase [Chitinophagaceae bacterium 26-R-25]|nr:tyrosine-type recombinase/integrase [Chitinophagaceae bacterium 26-R-25]
MQVLQKLSFLIYLRKTRKSEKGIAPIYVRISIDGLRDEIATGISLPEQAWDAERKVIRTTFPGAVNLNKRLIKIQADLEQHFNILKAQFEAVTPAQVKNNYKTPINAQAIEKDKEDNLSLSEQLDALITKYLTHNDDYLKAYAFDAVPSEEKNKQLQQTFKHLRVSLESLTFFANKIFDNKKHKKTFLLAINEYLLNFLQLCLAGKRSPNSLEKMIGRKKRYQSFIFYRYKKHDLFLEEMQYNFISDLHKYQLTHFGVGNNTASKYSQSIKEIFDRAVANGWISSNMFTLFKCGYKNPIPSWPTMEQMHNMKELVFEKGMLNEVRDVFLFGCYTGLSYLELFNLSAKDIVKGFDEKLWINTNRQKSSNEEAVPLLPPAIKLLDKYSDHPVCVRRNRLLPVPTNQAYNRALKEVAAAAGIKIKLNTHKARFFFANEIAFNNGVELKTVSRMLGHTSVKTTEVYVWANKKNISESMEKVADKLIDDDGEFKRHSKRTINKNQSVDIERTKTTNPLKVIHLSK